jgi:hypothetical protein
MHFMLESMADLNAVDNSISVAGHVGDGGFHLRGAHVLAAPAERVARAVAEVQVAQLVRHQDVAWTVHSVTITYIILRPAGLVV